MIRRPPRSTLSSSSAASDVYKRQSIDHTAARSPKLLYWARTGSPAADPDLSLIHISEPTRLLSISYAVFCLKKKNQHHPNPDPHTLVAEHTNEQHPTISPQGLNK